MDLPSQLNIQERTWSLSEDIDRVYDTILMLDSGVHPECGHIILETRPQRTQHSLEELQKREFKHTPDIKSYVHPQCGPAILSHMRWHDNEPTASAVSRSCSLPEFQGTLPTLCALSATIPRTKALPQRDVRFEFALRQSFRGSTRSL